MIKDKMQDAINKQINEELYSYYLYLSMAAHFQAVNLPGVANWFQVQTQEEMFHAMKFFNYVLERGGRVELQPIEGPPFVWKTPLEAFEAGYKHELHITECINNLVDLSIDEKDHAANMFLQWYVNEQVEEEANSDAVVQKLRMVEGNPSGLYLVDRELATRVFVPPAAGGAGAGA